MTVLTSHIKCVFVHFHIQTVSTPLCFMNVGVFPLFFIWPFTSWCVSMRERYAVAMVTYIGGSIERNRVRSGELILHDGILLLCNGPPVTDNPRWRVRQFVDVSDSKHTRGTCSYKRNNVWVRCCDSVITRK